MPWYYDIGFAAIITAAGFPFEALALSKFKLWFITPREGTANFVVAGETFRRVIMAWKDNYLNEPGTPWHDSRIPDWEVLEVGGTFIRGNLSIPNLGEMPKIERFPVSPMRILDRYGIRYYGFWPLEKIHRYRFKWTEDRIKNGVHEAWDRNEITDLIYVQTTVYRVRVVGAENKDGESLDLDYLLSVRVNNPYIARFKVTNWLERLTADANNAVKNWVGSKNFKEITQEKENPGEDMSESGFVASLNRLNYDLPTEHGAKGAPEVIGVTITASSLQRVEFSGSNQEALVKAASEKIVAERQADAVVAKAEGDKKAAILRAEGDRQAEILRGEGVAQADRAKLDVIREFGDVGVIYTQAKAMESPGDGKTVVVDLPFLSRAAKDLLNPKPGAGPTTNDNGKE